MMNALCPTLEAGADKGKTGAKMWITAGYIPAEWFLHTVQFSTKCGSNGEILRDAERPFLPSARYSTGRPQECEYRDECSSTMLSIRARAVGACEPRGTDARRIATYRHLEGARRLQRRRDKGCAGERWRGHRVRLRPRLPVCITEPFLCTTHSGASEVSGLSALSGRTDRSRPVSGRHARHAQPVPVTLSTAR